MRQKEKSLFLNIIFVFTCLLIAGLSLYYFFTDINRTSVRNDTEIAKIYFKKKIAQRKFSDSVVWERLQTNSPLYNEDIIRTDIAAAATMNFTNGAVVDLDESTMIQIFSGKNGELKFAVSGGNFNVDTTEATAAVKIDLGNGSVINLEKGSRLSASNEDGKNSIIIQEGTGSISSGDGTEDFIMAGESIKIDENGNRKKIPVVVSNLNTAQKVLKFENKVEHINFDLKVDNNTDNKKIILETSSDPSFSKDCEKIIVDSDNVVDLEAVKGVLFYRVYAEGEEEDAYEGKILVEEIRRPVLTSPSVDSVYETVNVMPQIYFSWDAGVYSDYCRIEIYDENDIKNPVFEQDVTESSISVSTLSQGKYFWRVVPHYSVNSIGFGDASSFSNFKIDKIQVSTIPELLVPASGANLVVGKEEKPVLFACKSDVKDCSYRFEVSSSLDFEKNMVYSSTETSLRRSVPVSIESLKAGKYFWRVARVDDDNKNYYSSVREFSVSEYVPQVTQLVFPPENYNVESSRVMMTQFIWKLSDSFDRDKTDSVVQIAKNENFTEDLSEYKTNTVSYSGIKLAQGTYYWRVKALDAEKGTEITQTPYRKLTVLNELSAPRITSPVNNSALTLIDENSVTVKWDRVSEADYYKLKVFNPETNKVIAQIDSTKENSVTIAIPSEDKKTLAGSSFRCSLQALTQEAENAPARISKPVVANFVIEVAKKIKLTAPLNNAFITGLDAVKNPVEFLWSEDESEKSREFVLQRLYSNGTSKVVYSSNKAVSGLQVRRLAPGNYRWTVNAKAKDGTVLTPDTSFVFTVGQVAELSRASLVAPSDRFIVDVNYLKNNRTISFNWKPVLGATDYQFVLYQKNENGTLRRVLQKDTKNSTYILSDLTKLDVGIFEWHVTAFSRASDGFVEQKSQVAKSEFSVSFELPDTVKTIDPGRMYGE